MGEVRRARRQASRVRWHASGAHGRRALRREASGARQALGEGAAGARRGRSRRTAGAQQVRDLGARAGQGLCTRCTQPVFGPV